MQPATDATTVDMLDAVETLNLAPIVQHNAPALQQTSTDIAVVPLSGPMGAALQWMKQGATLAELRELLAMQREHEDREAEKAFNAAFAAFKAEAIVIVKNQRVNDGPLVGKMYEDLFSVTDAVTPLLSKHGLSASWKTTRDEAEWIEVTCTLKHVLGHRESVSMGGPPDSGGAKNKIQARASTYSYLCRYTLKAILGVAARGEDNDGNGGEPKDPAEGINPDLLQRARTASLEGWKALAAFTKALTKEERAELDPVADALKLAAKKADAA
jgi:hypothetical protein